MTAATATDPVVALVVAVTQNGVIGRDGGLPWRLSTDLRRFKALTMGHPIVMGRRTWESFPRQPLPGRTNIVVTRNRDYRADGALIVSSLDEAMRQAAQAPGGDEIFVIGGADIFTQSLETADRLLVTHIDTRLDGDVHFPAIDRDIWRAAHEESVPAGERDEHPTRYVVYERQGR